MLKKSIILVSLFMLVFLGGIFSADYFADDIYIQTGVDAGLGGPYPTDHEGLETIFANPAGFQSAEPGFAFADLAIQLKGPIFDITDLVFDIISGNGDVNAVLASPETQKILQGLYAGFTIGGPIFFGYAGDGFGFGLFNSTDFLVRGKGPLSLSMSLEEQILLTGGYSFRIPLTMDKKHTIDLGLMLKGGVNGRVNMTKSFLELPTFISNFAPDFFMKEPFDFTVQIGLDAGLIYIWDGILSAGISFQDCYSPTLKHIYQGGVDSFLKAGPKTDSQGIIPFKMNAGIEFNPSIPLIKRWITNFRLMFAYDDILDFLLYPTEAVHWLLHAKAGLEITMLEILDLRVGLSEGLLNAGLGLDMQIFQLNVAMFGDETASQPGINPVYNLVIAFIF